MTEHRVYKSLGNCSQILGCDRELFMCNTLALVTLSIFTYNAITLVLTFVMCSIIYFCLYQMGKRDAHMRYVWIRSLKYKRYYTAHCQMANEDFRVIRR